MYAKTRWMKLAFYHGPSSARYHADVSLLKQVGAEPLLQLRPPSSARDISDGDGDSLSMGRGHVGGYYFHRFWCCCYRVEPLLRRDRLLVDLDARAVRLG